jgi:hypothetical protein
MHYSNAVQVFHQLDYLISAESSSMSKPFHEIFCCSPL